MENEGGKGRRKKQGATKPKAKRSLPIEPSTELSVPWESSGGLTIDNGGMLDLHGENYYSGGTIIGDGGTLVLGGHSGSSGVRTIDYTAHE